MFQQQQLVSELQPKGQSAAVPANENTLNVVALPVVEEGFGTIESKLAGLKNASIANVMASIADLESTITDIRKQIVGAAIEAVTRTPDGRVEITGAPAIILQLKGDYKPGEWVKDKSGIFTGEFDLVDANGKKLGVKTNWFDAAIDLGKPKTFNDTAKTVANANENSRGGLALNPARYEAELFDKLKTGEGFGKNVIAPLEVVKAIYKLRNEGEYKRLSQENSPAKLITTASGTDDAHWQWSCTPHRGLPDNVRVVDFTDGYGDWHHRDYARLSGRACFAELAL